MKVNDDIFYKVLHHSRINVPEEGFQGLKKDLEDVLKMCEKLDGVDTDGVSPMDSPIGDVCLGLETGRGQESFEGRNLISNSAFAKDNFIAVPKILNKGKRG